MKANQKEGQSGEEPMRRYSNRSNLHLNRQSMEEEEMKKVGKWLPMRHNRKTKTHQASMVPQQNKRVMDAPAASLTMKTCGQMATNKKKRYNTTGEKDRGTPQPGNTGHHERPNETQPPASGNQGLPTTPQLQATRSCDGVWDTAPQPVQEMAKLLDPQTFDSVGGNDSCSSRLGILLRGGNLTIFKVKEVGGRHVLIADVIYRNTSLKLINVYAPVIQKSTDIKPVFFSDCCFLLAICHLQDDQHTSKRTFKLLTQNIEELKRQCASQPFLSSITEVLDDSTRERLDQPLSLDQLSKALVSLDKNKTPKSDSLPENIFVRIMYTYTWNMLSKMGFAMGICNWIQLLYTNIVSAVSLNGLMSICNQFELAWEAEDRLPEGVGNMVQRGWGLSKILGGVPCQGLGHSLNLCHCSHPSHLHFIWRSKMDRGQRYIMYKTLDKVEKNVPNATLILLASFDKELTSTECCRLAHSKVRDHVLRNALKHGAATKVQKESGGCVDGVVERRVVLIPQVWQRRPHPQTLPAWSKITTRVSK
eukprot:g48062.t1